MAKKNKRETPPADEFCPEARALWNRLVSDATPRAAKAGVRQVLLALTAAERAREQIAREGRSYRTRTGTIHAHPLLRFELEHRKQFLKGLSLLETVWRQSVQTGVPNPLEEVFRRHGGDLEQFIEENGIEPSALERVAREAGY